MPLGPSPTDPPQGDGLDAPADDDDYELEPIDPVILENQRRIAEAEVKRAEMTLDIDRLDAESHKSTSLDKFANNFKFQFQTKHLLMATAGVAVALSLGKLMGSNLAALFVIFLAFLIGAHAYLGWQDRQREEKIREKRRRIVELARAREDDDLDEEDRAELAGLAETLAEEEELAAPKRKAIRLAFSMKELMIAMTVSAVALGLLMMLGPNLAAGVLGLMALVGLIVFAIGWEVPAALMLGWWVILVLYIGVSFAGSFISQTP